MPLSLEPGTHTVSRVIPVHANSQRSAAQATPATTTRGVSVRVGKNDCGGFNGHVSRGFQYIEIWGQLWDNCDYYTPNTTVYLYLGYTVNVVQRYNPNVAYQSAGSFAFDWRDSPSNSPSDITVDACLKWGNGWGCGLAQAL